MRKNANSEVLLKCITQDDGIKLLDDIHAGSCGNHVASRTLVRKGFPSRFLKANRRRRRREAGLALRRVPVLRQKDPCTCSWDLDDSVVLAIRLLGS